MHDTTMRLYISQGRMKLNAAGNIRKQNGHCPGQIICHGFILLVFSPATQGDANQDIILTPGV
jgi:hypothetical protein